MKRNVKSAASKKRTAAEHRGLAAGQRLPPVPGVREHKDKREEARQKELSRTIRDKA